MKKKVLTFISFLFLSTALQVEALKLPDLPEISDNLLTINTTKTPLYEKCVAINLQSGQHNLIGTLHLPTTPRPKDGYPAVICFHGFRGSKLGGLKGTYRKLARELARVGIACVRFDLAGCGESEGICTEIPIRTYLKNGEDILHAVATQYSEINSFRIGLAGFSLGCHTAFHLARIYSPSKLRIRAMSIWAPIADGGILFREMYEVSQKNIDIPINLGEDFGFDPLPLVICPEDVHDFLSVQDHIVLNSLPVSIPILHMHALNDNLVSLTQQTLFRNTAPSNIQFKTYENTSHNLDSSPYLKEILHDIVTHFQTYL
ncbi:alpha/beta hydrolase [Chlamydia avium]|uniref:Phospholipase/Carboxylesterase family protein n=1 Tax=Chlamydia avium 10DC88 TaxID=1229831 RepID=W8JLV6_9CHLA|nr:alpha/beta hydrolase [Chlamydia avium]AHK63259.1 Phospholipase/Carboxylesterase family protein [Chlamydia avium 10DC88]